MLPARPLRRPSTPSAPECQGTARTAGRNLSERCASKGSIPERLSVLERVLNAFERLSFAAELEKRLTSQIQEVRLADRRTVRQRPPRQEEGERAANQRVMLA